MYILVGLQVERDIMIWNNKRWQGKPMFVKSKEDALISRHRRWYSQFYSEHSPRMSFQKDTLDWWYHEVFPNMSRMSGCGRRLRTVLCDKCDVLFCVIASNTSHPNGLNSIHCFQYLQWYHCLYYVFYCLENANMDFQLQSLANNANNSAFVPLSFV